MGLFISQVINGFVIGILYGLAALGFTMVYKALGYLNFAHSDTIMLGAMVYCTLITGSGIPAVAAFFVTLVVLLLYGVVCEKVLFIRFQKTSAITFMLASMSLSTVVKNIALKVFGALPRGLSIHYTDASFTVSGMRISCDSLVIFAIALFVLAILQLFFNKTKFGLAIRMAQEDPETASTLGVNVLTTRAATFAISAGLGCVAGMLIGPIYSISTEIGAQISLKAFISAVVGGLGNFPGAIVGGILVGLTESLSTTYISSSYKDVIVYIAGLVVLGFFPYGIFRRVKSKY